MRPIPVRNEESSDKAEEAPKKRGFWARVFGKGKKDDKKTGRRQDEKHKKKVANDRIRR